MAFLAIEVTLNYLKYTFHIVIHFLIFLYSFVIRNTIYSLPPSGGRVGVRG